VAFVGIGTERLHREESRRFITTELVPRVRHWSVRSPRDRDRLLACGVEDRRVTVAADLAWTLDASVDGDRQAPACLLPRAGELIVGVNVTNEQFVADRAPRIFEVLAQLLDRLVERFGARVVFFCNEIREEESFDKAASGRVIAQMRRPERAAILPNDYRTPGQMMGLIGKCHLAIGMRYHFCLFAAIQGVPFIAIKRSDKVVDLCEDLSWTYGVGLDQLEALHLEELAAELLSDPPRATSALRDRVAPMRERVWLNRVSLDALRREQA
jgi:polysaccharide pyruvyl transferase WcaK-like protein